MVTVDFERGYDPDHVHGRKFAGDFEPVANAERRKRWAAMNRLEGENRQRGLSKPAAHNIAHAQGFGVGGFLLGYFFSKWF